MRLVVRFSGLFRSLSGMKEVTLDLREECTLRDALQELKKNVQPEFVTQILIPLLEENNTGPLCLLVKNHRHMHSVAEIDVPLKEGDTVSFLPPMEGG